MGKTLAQTDSAIFESLIMSTSAVLAFEAYQGKFTKTDAGTRVQTRHAQGLSVEAQLALGIDAKAAKAALTGEALSNIVAALAGGNIRPAVAAVVAKAKITESILTEDGKAPYSEWLRLQATLAQKAQVTNAGKPTAYAHALKLAQWLTNESTLLREKRNQAKIGA